MLQLNNWGRVIVLRTEPPLSVHRCDTRAAITSILPIPRVLRWHRQR